MTNRFQGHYSFDAPDQPEYNSGEILVDERGYYTLEDLYRRCCRPEFLAMLAQDPLGVYDTDDDAEADYYDPDEDWYEDQVSRATGYADRFLDQTQARRSAASSSNSKAEERSSAVSDTTTPSQSTVADQNT